MKINALIQNHLEANENIILSGQQKPVLFRFFLYLLFGQFLVIGGAIMIIIMTQDSFTAFWDNLSNIAEFLPYALIAILMLITFLVMNTIVKHRFHKELRTIYAFTNKGVILVHEATKEYPQPAIGRCNYATITTDNYKYFSVEKFIHFFDIKFDNPVFDTIKLYRFELGKEAEKILAAMEAERAIAQEIENNTLDDSI